MSDENKPSDVQVRVLDWNAEVQKLWGVKWNEPTLEYEFSNKRKFARHTEDSGVYKPQS